jgi:hypothetical protein
VAYVEKHRHDVAAKVVADVRVDIDRLDDTQVLRLAQYYLYGPPFRDFGDSRWGELGARRGREDPFRRGEYPMARSHGLPPTSFISSSSII